MDEVSGKFAKWVYDSGLHDGVAQEVLLQGVDVSAEVLSGGKQRIAWGDYVQMIENYHAEIGLEGMRETAFTFGTSEEIAPFGKMAGLFLSPRRLYHFMYRWVGNHFLRNVEFELGDDADGNLRVVSVIRADSRGSEVYFRTLTNVLAGTPLRIGLEPAKVEITSLSSHRAEYRLVMPKTTGTLRRVCAWPGKFWRSRISEREIMVRMQDEIRDGQTAMDRQRRDFAAMIESLVDPLFILGSAGETLFVNDVARRWFMVPDQPGDWRLEDQLEGAASDRWRDFFADGDADEQEFSFARKDQGGALVDLSFRPAQAVVFGKQDALLLVGRDVTERRRVELQMREAAFSERRKLAVELHDELGQDLTGISLRSDTLEKRLTDLAPSEAPLAGAIASAAREAIDRARYLARGLSVIDEREDNLRRGLVDHCRKLEDSVPFKVVLDLPVREALTLPGQEALEVLRIVQEACHNAVKHSGGTEIVVTVVKDEAGLELTVADDGVGIGTAGAVGLGVKSMPYRAAQLGGTFGIEARADGKSGTVVRLRLSTVRKLPESVVACEGGIRLVVADDQRVVLDGFVARFSLEPDIEICGQVSVQEEIVPTVLAARPDVLLTDMMMGAGDNIAVIKALRRETPKLGIVAISVMDGEYFGDEAILAGADAYLMKSASTAEVIRVMHEVAKRRGA